MTSAAMVPLWYAPGGLLFTASLDRQPALRRSRRRPWSAGGWNTRGGGSAPKATSAGFHRTAIRLWYGERTADHLSGGQRHTVPPSAAP